jgi:hypothetical protein
MVFNCKKCTLLYEEILLPRNKKWWGRASIDAGLLFLRDYLASMELPSST